MSKIETTKKFIKKIKNTLIIGQTDKRMNVIF